MNATFDGSTFDAALVALALIAGSAGYFFAPGYGDLVYYGLVTVGVLALGFLIVKNRLA